jgi:hypothetical protein
MVHVLALQWLHFLARLAPTHPRVPSTLFSRAHTAIPLLLIWQRNAGHSPPISPRLGVPCLLSFFIPITFGISQITSHINLLLSTYLEINKYLLESNHSHWVTVRKGNKESRPSTVDRRHSPPSCASAVVSRTWLPCRHVTVTAPVSTPDLFGHKKFL